jgi:hypothetical protein
MRAIISFFSVCALLLGLGLTAGCGAMGGGKTVVRYDESSPPIETKAPAQGSYALYSTMDTTPRVRVTLGEGDKIGFRKGDNGQLIAIAGSREVPLSNNATYYWKKE